ncbi:Short-chain dehydrogenase/reductase family 42E member 1 [Sesamum angolense]|uniref:Short-chain dehydrogenase/reductase family 42E member 1 n=1 Tax=Sesamum angolense TaxID=2727404 RepID=A0AAE1W6T8_9LAMI|nr:Short-chain dehydrogenase/reductase family 42E member 1 [Sesamum angolense]
MHLSENEGVEDKTFLVTGGLGFVGSTLCLELVRRGARRVRAFDFRPESPWSDDLRRQGVTCIRGDVSKKQDVVKALDGADCVFHLASYGMSGKEMLQYGRVDEININGTCHVLDACLEHGVSRLVYVSTYNVVFGGKEIVNGNEALPYFPLDDHVDPYGRSKSIAEQLVLKSNGRPFKERKGRFYSCAIRPAAIYGPGEERHLPRILKLAKLGLLPFKIGSTNVKSDWVYIDNLVFALLLASMELLDDIPGRQGQPIAAGQAYFISDGYPVNTFEFIRPLLKSLDYDLPKLSLAVPHALFLGKLFGFSTHFCWCDSLLLVSQSKGGTRYSPMVSPQEGMAATIAYWKERKRRTVDGPTIYTWLFVVIGMTMLLCAACMPDIGPVSLFRAISLFFLRSIQIIRVVFLLSMVAHVCEAVYAWQLARKIDPVNARVGDPIADNGYMSSQAFSVKQLLSSSPSFDHLGTVM